MPTVIGIYTRTFLGKREFKLRVGEIGGCGMKVKKLIEKLKPYEDFDLDVIVHLEVIEEELQMNNKQ